MPRRSVPIVLALVVAAIGNCQTGAGSAVCASCHSEIARSYQAMPMARSARKLDPSAAPEEQFDHASFLHSASGFRYRVSLKNSAYTLEFSSPAAGVNAAKPLSYAIGSGTRAFSYLMENDGFLYEAPVAYYAAANTWGLAPGYDGYTYPYLTRPALPGCLSCHASSLQTVAGTLNRYRSPAFLEGGVSCERCHGDGAKHIARMQSGVPTSDSQILNPTKLPPERRDSICSQCHLTGDARVMRPGSDWQSFKPGLSLNDYQTVFVRAPVSAGLKVTGHVENLALSACKRKAGDRLWCGSCHDPHAVPAPLQAKAWFRERCLSCHSTKACSENQTTRLKAQDDCIGCHMPRSPATDAQHVVLTDHTIPRRPRRTAPPPSNSDAELAPFGKTQTSERDLALAYGIAAIGRKTGSDRMRALNLLEKVARQESADVEVLLFLAEIYRNDGRNALARPLYERAIALDPNQVTASVGLGGIMMEQGDYPGAIRLWTDALTKNAGLELVRLNLSLALLQTGNRAAAEANLKQALNLNPAFAPARALFQKLTRLP